MPKKMPKLQYGCGHYFLTIPVKLVLKKKWKKGFRLAVTDGGKNKVVVEKP